MTSIAPVPMGNRGRKWINDCLSRGGPLAKSFHRVADLQQGEVVALVPAETPEELLLEPEWGGVVTEGDVEYVLDMIADELVKKGARYVIAEDDVSREGDPVLDGEPDVVSIGDERVVFCAALPTSDPFHEHVDCGYPTVAFIVTAAESQSCNDVINAIKRGDTGVIIAITVGAYDAETWMIWRRT